MSTTAKTLLKYIKEGSKIFICGNGGSACNSEHLAEDLINKGVWAMSLTNIGAITSIANDYGYEHVFSRQIDVLCEEGDVLVTLSCSGRSPNIAEAIMNAANKGMLWVGFPTNKATGLTTPQTENVHAQIIHEIYEAL